MATRGKRTGQRNVPKSRTAAGRTGRIASNPKVYDGIQFRSLLEVGCYKKLKEAGLNFEYEKRKYVLLEGFYYSQPSFEDNGKSGFSDKFGHKVRDITYTPDFVDVDGKWIIECKGFANERFPLKWKMFKELLMRQGDPPALFVPRTQAHCAQVVETILTMKVPPN